MAAIMGWMSDQTLSNNVDQKDILWICEEGTSDDRCTTAASEFGLVKQACRWADIDSLVSLDNCKILICNLVKDHFTEEFSKLQKLQQLSPASVTIVLSHGLDIDAINLLINEMHVFAILQPNENLRVFIQKALEAYTDKKQYISALGKIKKQNRQLEELNENLESLVHVRTKKEFEANQKALESLKSMQSLLKFIKIVSRSDTLEDLMIAVRDDFKKFHGLRPPILLFTESQNRLRVYYFQGKQLTSRNNNHDEVGKLFEKDNAPTIRGELSNLFGRPFGPIEVSNLSFQSEELQSVGAKIICEHSFDSKNLDDFFQFSFERWSIINMALENILLQKSSKDIARQWARTFNEMKDPIIIIDHHYRMTLSNGNFHRQQDQFCYQAFAQRDSPCLDCPIQKTFEKGGAQYSDIHCLGKVFRVHSYPIRLDGGEQVSHAINQYVDISQSVDLQSRVIQGEKMAAIGLLAGNIAHELNNPLTGIYSLAGLLLEDIEQGTNTYKDLQEIRDAAHRCQIIIRDLLDFSSVGADSKVLEVNANEVIRKTLPLLKMSMRTHNCDIHLSEDEILIRVNPQLLQQVIFNLVNNACQAMHEGGSLSVSCARKEDICQIRISDTGPGIPEDLRELIFDPFFTTKDEGKGTGLGLSMSRSVIERFDGRLKLVEKQNPGAEFLIEFPVVKK
ncbi:MAG: HAMP domain-containing histidine kinase [Bdellovibrionales bacterium]|nr:HAMP domain-containing histidine kinase [Bdellovibrionales bacterium]